MATELVSGETREFIGKEVTLLSAVGETGAGSTASLHFDATTISWHIKVAGSPDSCTTKLQGTKNGGTTWDDISTSTTTSEEIKHVTGTSYEKIRGNVTVLSGGSNPTVTVKAIVKQPRLI